jgi:trk system potassium uptake protein
MYVIIVGGGKTGSQLARCLIAEGHKVKVIEQRKSVLELLSSELPPEVVLAGDGSSPAILETADIHHAQVLAAVTGEDEANLVITSLAKFEFGVSRTIARVNNPKNAWLYTAEMGVDVALNQSDILAHLIAEEMSLGDMMTLLKLRKGEYSVVEEKIHISSNVVEKQLKDIQIPKESTIAAIIRKGHLVIPHGDTTLQPGDEIIAVVKADEVKNLASILGFEKEV